MQEFLDSIRKALRVGLTYQQAWRELYNAFSERIQLEEMKLMDGVLKGVKLDFEERQSALQETRD